MKTRKDVQVTYSAAKLRAARDRLQKAQLRGVGKAGLLVENEASQRAPVLTGTLRASINTQVQSSNNTVSAVVSANTPYAVYQHEAEDWKHPKGGEAKYLENALKARTNDTVKVIENEIQKELQ